MAFRFLAMKRHRTSKQRAEAERCLLTSEWGGEVMLGECL